MKNLFKPGTIAAIIIGIILFAMSSCANKPIVNNQFHDVAVSLKDWKMSENPRITGDAANFHYQKGDSIRYIQTVGDRITIDLKGLSTEAILKTK